MKAKKRKFFLRSPKAKLKKPSIIWKLPFLRPFVVFFFKLNKPFAKAKKGKSPKTPVKTKIALRFFPSSLRILKPNLVRLFIKIFLVFFLIFLVSSGFLFFWITKDLPSPKTLETRDISVTTKIYDRKGRLLYKIYKDQNRSLINLEDIPSALRQATIAIEDKDFYKHGGFSIRGIVRSVKEITLGRKLQGGSTITQQLIKSALLTPQRTLERKIKELILAFEVERVYSKDQILEMYFNQVPYGGTAWGVEEAAEMYFGKRVSELNLAESAFLAGMPAAPTTYSPFGAHPELSKKRQFEVLRRMVEDGYITSKQERETAVEELHFAPQKTDIKAPHFVMYVREILEKKYGPKIVSQGGLHITTSLDLDLEEMAQKIVADEVEKLSNLRVGNGAAMITAPKTGEILAMVGSKDYFDVKSDGNVNVTTSSRQPGSAIKPLNYALGFMKGYTPATVLIDSPTEFRVLGQPSYKPVNYDGKSHGPVQVRFALGNSYNIPAVKMLAINGVSDFVKFANKMGLSTISDPSKYGLSLTLGGGEVTMVDMTTAFGVFANGGIKQKSTAILKVTDSKGNVLEEFKPSEGERIIQEDVSYLISHILLDNNARSAAFGSSSYLVIPRHQAVSVKTGTTDEKKDNWTIGYTPSFLVAVWVGNNNNTAMDPYLTSGVTGAAPIWNKIMTSVLKDKNDEWPKKPDSVVGTQICSLSGKLPANDCSLRYEFFIKGTEPKDPDDSKRKILIDKTTTKPATSTSSDVEEREAIVVSDPLTQNFCASCPW